MLYIAGRVVKHYSGPGCDAGQYAFSSAGKACKKVGLNKTLCQQKIRVKSQLIQLDSVSAGAGADKGKGALIAVMYNNVLPADDFLPKAFQKLFLGGSAMAACCYQDGDVRLRIPKPYLLQKKGHGDAAGHRTGVV